MPLRGKHRIAKGAVLGAAISNRRDSGSSSSGSDDESGPKVYAMREKMLALIRDDFKINRMKGRRGRGRPAFIAREKIARMRDTFELQSLGGDTLYQIQERKARVRDAMAIEDENGHKIAEIKKRKIGLVRDNYKLKIRDERDWEIHGSILEHDYTIREGGSVIATIHEKWIAPVQDCYFVDVDEGEDHALVLCVCIALEAMDED